MQKKRKKKKQAKPKQNSDLILLLLKSGFKYSPKVLWKLMIEKKPQVFSLDRSLLQTKTIRQLLITPLSHTQHFWKLVFQQNLKNTLKYSCNKHKRTKEPITILVFPARPYKDLPKAKSLNSKQEKETIIIYSDAFGIIHLECFCHPREHQE